MKIAIQGHLTRGKEVIRILESLGGINDGLHERNNPNCYYELHGNIIWCVSTKGINFKYYTLEEFEKEFPFKIGDKITNGCEEYLIIDMDLNACELNYKVRTSLGSVFWVRTCDLTAHYYKQVKEMKKERNIILTLDKAKEWYNKGGELKEVALQAYSEEELTKAELPKTWEEFCNNYPVQTGECFLSLRAAIEQAAYPCNRRYKNWIPSKQSAEAHLAMIQLEQLRNCYNDNSDAWGWSYSIIKRNGIPELVRGCDHDTFLRFKNETIAIQFLKNFRDLIEKAGDLI